eukprot:TRINITY_DN19253_c0_g1_i1.p1 TRINITY_DN19253_c0_g1~~TRINITY_DN19253_c0_g1_i1.p1  ORF type:complete len:116 (+),score=2.49 TRINITY_DN19253_c0_g1_i1:80-427(+)
MILMKLLSTQIYFFIIIFVFEYFLKIYLCSKLFQLKLLICYLKLFQSKLYHSEIQNDSIIFASLKKITKLQRHKNFIVQDWFIQKITTQQSGKFLLSFLRKNVVAFGCVIVGFYP